MAAARPAVHRATTSAEVAARLVRPALSALASSHPRLPLILHHGLTTYCKRLQPPHPHALTLESTVHGCQQTLLAVADSAGSKVGVGGQPCCCAKSAQLPHCCEARFDCERIRGLRKGVEHNPFVERTLRVGCNQTDPAVSVLEP